MGFAYDPLAKHLREARLANAWLPADKDYASIALTRPLPPLHEQRHLFFAPDERRQCPFAVRGIEPTLRSVQLLHSPHMHRLSDANQRALTQISELEGMAHQSTGRGRNHDLVGPSQLLETRGNIRGLADRQLRLGAFRIGSIANHHRACGDADATREWVHEAHPFHGLHNLQRRTYGALGIILVGNGPTEVDHQPIAQMLGDMAVIARHHLGARGAARLHQLAQVLWVEALGQPCGADHIAKHHGELPPLGVLGGATRRCTDQARGLTCRLRARRSAERLYRDHQLTPRTRRQPESVDVRFREVGQHIERDLVRGKDCFVLVESTVRQPVPDVGHICSRIRRRHSTLASSRSFTARQCVCGDSLILRLSRIALNHNRRARVRELWRAASSKVRKTLARESQTGRWAASKLD